MRQRRGKARTRHLNSRRVAPTTTSRRSRRALTNKRVAGTLRRRSRPRPRPRRPLRRDRPRSRPSLLPRRDRAAQSRPSVNRRTRTRPRSPRRRHPPLPPARRPRSTRTRTWLLPSQSTRRNLTLASPTRRPKPSSRRRTSLRQPNRGSHHRWLDRSRKRSVCSLRFSSTLLS